MSGSEQSLPPTVKLAGIGAWTKSLAARAMVICLTTALLTSVVMIFRLPVLFPLLQEPEAMLQDQFFVWRGAARDVLGLRKAASADVVLVTVDDESARRMGAYPPWPRKLYAALTRTLSDAGADVIAFDMIFDGPSPMIKAADFPVTPRLKNFLRSQLDSTWSACAEADDQSLIDEFKTRKNIVLATNVELSLSLFNGKSKLLFHTPYQPFISALGGDASCLGNVVVEPDVDGIVRRGNLISSNFPHVGSFYCPFALRVAEKKLHAPAVQDADKVYLRDRSYPRSFNINYLGPPGTFQAIPFWKALQWKKHFASTGQAEEADVEGAVKALNPFAHKIVLIGYQDLLAEDAATTSRPSHSSMPYSNFLTPVGGFSRPMSSVELQANLVQNLLSGRLLHVPNNLEVALTLLFVAILFARLFSALQGHPRARLSAILGFSLVWIACSFLAFVYLECLIPCAVPILGVVFPSSLIVLADQNLFILAQRRRHTGLFHQLAPKKLAAEIDRQQPSTLALTGKESVVTALVCEIDDFAGLMENQSPETVVSMLNQCLNIMTASVYEHEGIVDRFLSYGVMALWGAPLPLAQDKQSCLAAQCALDINRRLAELSVSWRQERLLSDSRKLIGLAGINTGSAVCGRIGSQDNTTYGAIGKSVDLAMSFKAENTTYGTTCLIGETTSCLIEEHFETRRLGRVSEAGCTQQYDVYQLLCPAGALPGALEESLSLYGQGLTAMDAGDFPQAARLFLTALRMAPDDGPAGIMLARCRKLMSCPQEQVEKEKAATSPDSRQ